MVKVVKKTGTDSLVTLYGYDAHKRLISVKETGTDQGDQVDQVLHFHRNASGVVTDYAIIDADLLSVGIDSITTVMHYNSSRYTSRVLNVNVFGSVLSDSSIFTYDASGKIIQEDVYQSPTGTANDFYYAGKLNYIFSSGGNLTQFEIHDIDSTGSDTFWVTLKITYDTKTSPLLLGNEGIALGGDLEWISPHNPVSEQSSDSNGSSDDQFVTTIYNYNNDNKPSTAVVTLMPDNTVTNISYYYQ